MSLVVGPPALEGGQERVVNVDAPPLQRPAHIWGQDLQQKWAQQPLTFSEVVDVVKVIGAIQADCGC